MNYEIVNLEEKIVVGLSAKLLNNDPEMPQIIGGLWGNLYQGGVYSTRNNFVQHTLYEVIREKNRVSHRGQALAQVKAEISKIRKWLDMRLAEEKPPKPDHSQFENKDWSDEI